MLNSTPPLKSKFLSNDDLLPGADVVVVGGGVVGIASALLLARSGVKVCIIERGDIGAGTTSAAAAAALLQTKTSAQKLALANESLAFLDELHRQYGGSFEYEHTGSMLAACSEDELAVVKEMLAKLESLGLDVQWVGGDQARAMMPVLGPAVIGATYSPKDATINPLQLIMTYARAAREQGAIIHTFTNVTGIERSGGKITGVITDRGRIRTETVVNAAGVWSGEIGRLAGVVVPVTPIKGELLITEAMPPSMRGTLISAKYLLSKARLEVKSGGEPARRSVGITLVQVAHGNFLVGSTREDDGYNIHSTYAGMRELVRQLLEITPCLSNLHLIRAYAGLRPITPDGMPIIGRAPELPGFITAAGHGGDGLVLSAVTARMVKEIVTGAADPLEIAPYSSERFTHQEVKG